MKKMIIIGIGVVLLFFVSCTLQFQSKVYSMINVETSDYYTVYLEGVVVHLSNIVDIKEISELFYNKIFLILKDNKKVVFSDSPDEAGYILQPELNGKKYEDNFITKYYVNFSLGILNRQGERMIYMYEYNGDKSLFNLEVQNSFFKSIERDLKKIFR